MKTIKAIKTLSNQELVDEVRRLNIAIQSTKNSKKLEELRFIRIAFEQEVDLRFDALTNIQAA
jgi:arginine repressor